jgi:hypothetical protein
MNEQTERVPSQPDTKAAALEPQEQADSSYYGADEIKGWALQWDTTELRKTNLARKMQHLRQSSPDQ